MKTIVLFAVAVSAWGQCTPALNPFTGDLQCLGAPGIVTDGTGGVRSLTYQPFGLGMIPRASSPTTARTCPAEGGGTTYCPFELWMKTDGSLNLMTWTGATAGTSVAVSTSADYRPNSKTWSTYGTAPATWAESTAGTYRYSWTGGGADLNGKTFVADGTADFDHVFRIAPIRGGWMDFNTVEIGVFLSSGTNSWGCGSKILFGASVIDTVCQSRASASGSPSAVSPDETIHATTDCQVYWRVQWVASTHTQTISWSPDGMTWIAIKSDTAFFASSAPTKIGVYATSSSVANPFGFILSEVR